MAGKFQLKTSNDGKFMFNLKAGNGEIILTSQRYTEKSSATDGIESVRTNSADDGRFVREDSSSGQPYFTLTAANGQVIGRSEMYSSASARDNGIESVKKNAPDAAVSDET